MDDIIRWRNMRTAPRDGSRILVTIRARTGPRCCRSRLLVQRRPVRCRWLALVGFHTRCDRLLCRTGAQMLDAPARVNMDRDDPAAGLGGRRREGAGWFRDLSDPLRIALATVLPVERLSAADLRVEAMVRRRDVHAYHDRQQRPHTVEALLRRDLHRTRRPDRRNRRARAVDLPPQWRSPDDHHPDRRQAGDRGQWRHDRHSGRDRATGSGLA